MDEEHAAKKTSLHAAMPAKKSWSRVLTDATQRQQPTLPTPLHRRANSSQRARCCSNHLLYMQILHCSSGLSRLSALEVTSQLLAAEQSECWNCQIGRTSTPTLPDSIMYTLPNEQSGDAHYSAFVPTSCAFSSSQLGRGVTGNRCRTRRGARTDCLRQNRRTFVLFPNMQDATRI